MVLQGRYTWLTLPLITPSSSPKISWRGIVPFIKYEVPGRISFLLHLLPVCRIQTTGGTSLVLCEFRVCFNWVLGLSMPTFCFRNIFLCCSFLHRGSVLDVAMDGSWRLIPPPVCMLTILEYWSSASHWWSGRKWSFALHGTSLWGVKTASSCLSGVWTLGVGIHDVSTKCSWRKGFGGRG